MQTFLAGFFFSLSLIAAIGAQNAFVLRQGLLRQHVLAVCLFCATSDAVLISAGVAGAGVIADRMPWLLQVMRWGGAAFLIVYGARAFRSALRSEGGLYAADMPRASFGTTMLTVAALTWLNPHVYLDTVALMGSVSTNWDNKWAFASGAISASFLFFLTLGFGARFLAPLFQRPRAWQVLDFSVAIVMWLIALGLLVNR